MSLRAPFRICGKAVTAAVDDRKRKALQAAIGWLRSMLEADLAARLAETFCIYEDRAPDAESVLRLDRATRSA